MVCGFPNTRNCLHGRITIFKWKGGESMSYSSKISANMLLNPISQKAVCGGCSGSCSGSCGNSCNISCAISCVTSCGGTCKDDCIYSCDNSCSAECAISCTVGGRFHKNWRGHGKILRETFCCVQYIDNSRSSILRELSSYYLGETRNEKGAKNFGFSTQ